MYLAIVDILPIEMIALPSTTLPRQCNFCRAEVATSCDFIAILVQFDNEKRQCARLFRKQKLCAFSQVKLLLKVTVFRELHLKPRR